MFVTSLFVLASFTAPEEIKTNPQSMIWLVPLVAAIAVAYKATKVPKISARSFLRETVAVFGSIVAFIIVAALVLHALAWLITE
jgi:hypothetical protein